MPGPLGGGRAFLFPITFFTAAHCAKKVQGPSLASLTSALAEQAPPGEADYGLFRACLNTRDAASKFLALFRLLGRLADPTGKDRQPVIDAVIKKKEPGVAESVSPKTGDMETVYSRLRNEYMDRSHIAPG